MKSDNLITVHSNQGKYRWVVFDDIVGRSLDVKEFENKEIGRYLTVTDLKAMKEVFRIPIEKDKDLLVVIVLRRDGWAEFYPLGDFSDINPHGKAYDEMKRWLAPPEAERRSSQRK